MKHQDIIEKMTLEDKIALCSGKDFWHTKDIDFTTQATVKLQAQSSCIRPSTNLISCFSRKSRRTSLFQAII